MRIGVFANSQIVNANYRAFPVVALKQRGHDLCLALERGNIPVEELKRCDVVHVHRYFDDGARRVVQQLREAGVGIVWDNDDDLTSGTQGAFRTDALRSQRAVSETKRMLALADVVTTSSRVLAEQYRELGAEDVQVVENYIPATFPPEGAVARAGGIVVGWTASDEHRRDRDMLPIRDSLMRLLERVPAARVATVGVALDLPPDRYAHIPFVQYHQLGEQVARFDIGIAPLADFPFNRARSNVKVKEYASVGVPWLASPLAPYAGLGEREGGRLVPDDRWYEELEQLVTSDRTRRKLAKRAAKWGASQAVLQNLDAIEAPLLKAARRAQIAV